MAWRYAIIFVGLTACATVDTPVHRDLTDYSAPLKVQSDGSNATQTIAAVQPEPYSTILRSQYKDMRVVFDQNFQTLRIARLSNKQSRLPQIKPGANVGTSGGANVTLGLRQVIYDGGVYRAQFASDDHNAILRQIELFQDLNRKASDEISVYLNYRKNLERHALLNRLTKHLQSLFELSDTRVKGGITAESEVSLFRLKLSEIRTDARIALSDAQADKAVIGDYPIKSKAKPFRFFENRLPLTVLNAKAGVEAKRSEFELAKKQAVPKVVLDAKAGIQPSTWLTQTSANIAVETDPISFGGNVTIQRARQEFILAQHELTTAIKEAEREKLRLTMRLSALQEQAAETEELSKQAQYRFDGFSNEFQAGTANLTEAVGILETLRQSLESKVRLRFEILDIQRQLAEFEGHFWDLGGVEASET